MISLSSVGLFIHIYIYIYIKLTGECPKRLCFKSFQLEMVRAISSIHLGMYRRSMGYCFALAAAKKSSNFGEVMNSSPSETMAANLIKGVLGALQHLHKQEIIYRKVSPENIFLTTERFGNGYG